MDSSEPQSPNGDKETRQRFRAEERPGAIHAVAHFLRENRWFWAAVFLVLVFTLFAREFRIQPPPPLPKGSVATRDLRAPFDFQVVDEVATAQKRQEARARVLPVYDWDSGKTSQTAAAVAQVFVT